MLIVSRSKLYYTASGITTPVGGRPVHRLREDHSAIGKILCHLKIPRTPAGIETATFRFVAQHLNHCATVVKVPPTGVMIPEAV